MSLFLFFFFNDTATTEIYTLSLHDALPISLPHVEAILGLDVRPPGAALASLAKLRFERSDVRDRKSTRLNSSHLVISYAVFCLKKKKNSASCTIVGNRCPSASELLTRFPSG